MAVLFSQYASGTQFSAGVITGSSLGVSGLNPIVDRLNSITSDNSIVSGTTLSIYSSGGNVSNQILPFGTFTDSSNTWGLTASVSGIGGSILTSGIGPFLVQCTFNHIGSKTSGYFNQAIFNLYRSGTTTGTASSSDKYVMFSGLNSFDLINNIHWVDNPADIANKIYFLQGRETLATGSVNNIYLSVIRLRT